MQTNATIAGAAVAQERNPTQTVKVDWDNNGNYTDSYDDLSSRVESITIQRQLATDLPDEVSRVAGYSAADLTMTLSGDPATEGTSAASYFSPFNTASALYGKRRRWRNCQVQIGFGGTNLPVFTGKTTGLQVDSATRTATLTAIDNAETMRGIVDLPVVVADDGRVVGSIRPNMSGAFVVDYLARKCGYYATPAARTGCLFLATFAGSAYPEVGTTAGARLGAGQKVPFTAGKFVQAAYNSDPANSSLVLSYDLSGSASTNDGGEVLIEGWTKIAGSTAAGICSVASSHTDDLANKVTLTVDSSNHLLVNYRRTNHGAMTGWNSGLTVPTTDFAYVAAHLYFTSSTVTIQARVNGSGASTGVATSSVTAQPALSGVDLDVADDNTGTPLNGSGLGYEAWQVSNPGIGTSAPAWNNGFVATSTIQPSLNVLFVTVPSTVSAWEQIQQIAAAEFATAGFDEFGNFFYYNRNRWTSAPYTTSQRTINASDSLTAIATSETTDQLRNHVRITATPAALNVAGWVWAASSVITVPASGSTTVIADMGMPIYGLSTSIRYASASGMSGQSQYRANRNRDGSGTAVSNLTFTVTVSAGQTASIQITNPNAFTVYMVSSSGFTDPAGTPSLALWGQQVLFAQSAQPDMTSASVTIPAQVIADVSDATSIGQHGDQLLDLSGNAWLQDGTSITTLASDLLARLKDPLPMLDGLTIIGDPRLQLGDRVTIVESTLGLNGDFFLTGITSTFDASGYTQAMTVRAIS